MDIYDHDDGYWDGDELDDSQYRKRHPAYKILAAILLLLFIFLSVPHIPLLFSDKLEFLQSRAHIQDNPVLNQTVSAVVSIEAFNDERSNLSRGTGFNISSNGLIITNQHVVEKSSSIKIEFADGKVFYSNDIYCLENADIAVLKLDGTDLPCVSLQIEKMPEPGVMVSVIGNPLGLKQIILQGPLTGYYLQQNIPVMLLDINCQPGNSGSPVVNEQGEVVGVVYAVTYTEQGNKMQNDTLAYPLYNFRDYLAEMN